MSIDEESASVDLTEDEDSSEENCNGFQFVDCSSHKLSEFSTPPPPVSPLTKVTTPQITAQKLDFKPVCNILKKPSRFTVFGQSKVRKLPVQFQSIQIRPPFSPEVNQSEKIETVCIDSDEGGECENSKSDVTNKVTPNVPKAQTIYAPNPPGKVLMIKKNNKYYKIVIPHNVMPNITQSTGPVIINIPEVGPLVITNDPQVTKASPVKPQTNIQQLSLNLDDINLNSVETTKKSPKKLMSIKEAALSSKKFCWSYSLQKKRDLEGFSYSDRLGFNQTECRRARKCGKTLELLIKNKEEQLIKNMNQVKRFRNTMKRKKLVKITDIIDRLTKEKIDKEKFHPKGNTPPKKSFQRKAGNKSGNRIPSNIAAPNSDYDSDLLLTKKVVILDGRNQEVGTEKRMKRRFPKVRLKQKQRKMLKPLKRKTKPTKRVKTNCPGVILKPCFVKMEINEQVEEAYKRYCKYMRLNVKQKVLKSPKISKHRVDSKIVAPTYSSGPNPRAPKDKKLLESNIKMFTSKIINTERKFQEIHQFKPILIIKEHLPHINYSNEFSKSNIIYIVHQNKAFPKNLLQNEDFVSAVELGYIKLVDSQLFCRYIQGGIHLLSQETKTCISEHNYSLKN